MATLLLSISLALALTMGLAWWAWRRPAARPAAPATSSPQAHAPALKVAAKPAGAAPQTPALLATEATPAELAALSAQARDKGLPFQQALPFAASQAAI